MWIYTTWIITLMTDHHSLWNRTYKYLVGQPMGILSFFFNFHLPVAVWMSHCKPFPTLVRFFNINFSQKSFLHDDIIPRLIKKGAI